MKFVFVPGLFSDRSIVDPLKARLETEYPGSKMMTVSSIGFKTVWGARWLIRMIIDWLSGERRGREDDIVLIGHSAGGQIIIPFIDDSRVRAVISICPPGHNPLDYPLKVWAVQSLYTIQTVFNQLFCIKEKHRAELFGGVLPEYMKALSYGWFALQMSMGVLLGNFRAKTKAWNKFLAFWSDGDPTIKPEVVMDMSIRHHGSGVGIKCSHHYPIIVPECLDVIVAEIKTFLLRLE